MSLVLRFFLLLKTPITNTTQHASSKKTLYFDLISVYFRDYHEIWAQSLCSPLWYSAAGCEAEAAQTHACTTLFSHRRYCIIRLTRRKFSFSIFSLFFTSIFFPHVYAMHTTTTHADDTTGIPYKTNGYASEPDNTNYDSDYALKYHTLDRKRTTTTTSTVTGNQHDEKWVVMMMETFSNFV